MSDEAESLGIIVETPLDQRTLAYLVQTYGIEVVKRAREELPGQRRPYVSNIAKVLGATLPDSIRTAGSSVADGHIEQMRSILGSRPRSKS